MAKSVSRQHPGREQSGGDVSDSDVISDTSIQFTSSMHRNSDPFVRRQGYKRPNLEDIISRLDDSKRRPGPRGEQGTSASLTTVNFKGNRLATKSAQENPP